jgi:hypothetical protein
VEIASMIACGATAETIATTTGLDVNAVEDHLATCCATITDDGPDSLEKSDQRLRNLSELIGSASLAAGLQGDPKTQIAALAVALRAETELRRRLEDQIEKQHEQGGDIPPITIEQFDQLVEQAEAFHGPDFSLINAISWWVSYQLEYAADAPQLALILQFLKISLPVGQISFAPQNTGAELLRDFEAFIAKRTTPQPAQLVLQGEN